MTHKRERERERERERGRKREREIEALLNKEIYVGRRSCYGYRFVVVLEGVDGNVGGQLGHLVLPGGRGRPDTQAARG